MPESAYPNQYWGPRKPEENTVWEDANGRQMHVPYRGSEQHGVPHIVEYDAHDRNLVTEEHGYKTTGQVVLEPVPVVIVTEPLMAIEKKVVTSQWNLTQNGAPIQVCSRRLERNKVHLSASTGANIFVSRGATEAQQLGFPVPSGSPMGWNTNQPIWAYTTSANAVLYVAEEYEVKAGEKVA